MSGTACSCPAPPACVCFDEPDVTYRPIPGLAGLMQPVPVWPVCRAHETVVDPGCRMHVVTEQAVAELAAALSVAAVHDVAHLHGGSRTGLRLEALLPGFDGSRLLYATPLQWAAVETVVGQERARAGQTHPGAVVPAPALRAILKRWARAGHATTALGATI